MKWTYTIKNKLFASLVLLSLCFMVLLSNFIDRNHSKNVNHSISTLYEDRLIAEVYILKMTNSIYQIKEVINSDTSRIIKKDSIEKLLAKIEETNNAYLLTKFTDLEKIKADELLAAIQNIKPAKSDNDQINLNACQKALKLLNELSVIQYTESKKIMADSENLYLKGKISSKFVFVLIIIILIVLQALVFASKTIIPIEKNKLSNLN